MPDEPGPAAAEQDEPVERQTMTDEEREAMREALREAGRAASDAAAKVAAAAREIGRDLRGNASEAFDDIRAAAAQAGDRAREMAAEMMDKAREETTRIRDDVAAVRDPTPGSDSGGAPVETATRATDSAQTAGTTPPAAPVTPSGWQSPPPSPPPRTEAPPRPPEPATPHPPEESSTGFDANLAAALCYVFAPITGPLFYIIEKRSDFVRFHAMQAILFAAAAIVTLSVFLFLIWVPLLGRFMFAMTGLGFVVVWLLTMWKALNYKEFRLPFIGDVARSQVDHHPGGS